MKTVNQMPTMKGIVTTFSFGIDFNSIVPVSVASRNSEIKRWQKLKQFYRNILKASKKNISNCHLLLNTLNTVIKVLT